MEYTVTYKDYSATVRWNDDEEAYVGAFWSPCGMFGVEIYGRTVEEAQEDFISGMELLVLENDNS